METIGKIRRRHKVKGIVQKVGFNPVRQPPRDAVFPAIKEGCGLYWCFSGMGACHCGMSALRSPLLFFTLRF
jgi:hypothetical protein